VEKDRLVLDPRTVRVEEEDLLLQALKREIGDL